MPSSTTAHASHASASTLASHQEAVPALQLNKTSRARVSTYTAHALILSNLYGIPLSAGIWLEYYFTTAHPETPLLALAAIFAAQIACLGLSISMTVCLHARLPRYWRWMLVTGALLLCCAHIGLLTNTHPTIWALVLCQGALTGLGLGMMCAVSMRVSSAHYRHSIAIAARLCVSAGFAGAGVYTVVLWCCLRTARMRLAYGATLLLAGMTLVPALLLMEYSPPPITAAHLDYRLRLLSTAYRTFMALFALALILPSSVIPLLYLPLLLASRPNPYRADAGVYTLLALYGTACLSSAFAPRVYSSRLSASALCGAASILNGIAIIPLIWMLRLEVSVPCAVVYGAGLRAVCPLWAQSVVDCRDGGARPITPVLALLFGLCAAGAIVGGAAVLQGVNKGAGIVLGVVAGCSLLGGLIVGTERAVRHWNK